MMKEIVFVFCFYCGGFVGSFFEDQAFLSPSCGCCSAIDCQVCVSGDELVFGFPETAGFTGSEN